MDPDPRDPKRSGSGSPTLMLIIFGSFYNEYTLWPGGATRSPEAGEEAAPPTSLLAQHPGLACMGLAHAQQAPVLSVLSAEKLLGRREVARPDSAGPPPPPAPLFSRTGQLQILYVTPLFEFKKSLVLSLALKLKKFQNKCLFLEEC
jgi:hypothetical protein